jgi:predicted nucleic acid-binding protein
LCRNTITQSILREAAQLRATTKLRTPDALHAATAQQAGCVLFVTNDVGFRGVANLPAVILDDLLTP